MIDVDDLPPTQMLVCELLAARHRTGEAWWTLPSKVAPAVEALVQLGLVDRMSGNRPKTLRARLTAAGREEFMSAVWTPPAAGDLAALLRYAAEGRREYLLDVPVDMRPLVEVEVSTLESAAVVAEGRLDPLYGWLPSWRWTDEMSNRLRSEENA